ncbi:MAG: phosphatase PAP2 family protein, partial [Desulfohalobiaceae bacterium]|nr:phosphatase PAP2 family protein [Desulfohalobiaceae bacterium]
SGHTSMSLILYGFLAILLARELSRTWRWGLLSSVVLISFVIGFSRLYLGAHWLSDVLAGYFMGASWTALTGIAYLKRAGGPIPRRLLGVTVILVLVVAGGWHVFQRHATDMRLYAPRHDQKTIALSSWQDHAWRELPARRIDLGGECEQPLTVQWAGSPAGLDRFLAKKGWQQPPSLGLKTLFGLFSPSTPLEQLPVLPRLHDGRTERLCLVHPDQDRRLVLRLWPTDVSLAAQDTPLLVGIIAEQRRWSIAGLITMARDEGGYDRPLNLLEKTLSQEFTVKRVQRPDHDLSSEPGPQRPLWQGEVLLIWEKGLLPGRKVLAHGG